MMRIASTQPFVLTGTTPAAASSGVILGTMRGLARYNAIRVDALLQGATGGTLDLYLQRRVLGATSPNSIWLDWLHFTQLAGGAAAVRYSAFAGDNVPNVALATVGQMNDDLSVGAFALAAGTFVGGLPGDEVRLCAVAGTGTTAGALQNVYLTGFELFT